MTSRSERRLGLKYWPLYVLLLASQVRAEPAAFACADTLDPLLGCLAGWVGAITPATYGYTAVASGATLAVGYQPEMGFHLPASQRLSWPGNVCQLADSNYAPRLPDKLASAQSLLIQIIRSGRGALLVTPLPVYVYAADTSFGDPWFFVVRCRAGQPDTSMWDAGDLKRDWWLWTDDPGANMIWPRPARTRATRGRQAILAGLRHCVIAARPKTSGVTRTGLAAFDVGNQAKSPGTELELRRIAIIRGASSTYLLSELELWPPAERQPVKLAAYYLQKAAVAWTELSERAGDWSLMSAELRDELLTTVQSDETAAALALDGIVSSAQE